MIPLQGIPTERSPDVAPKEVKEFSPNSVTSDDGGEDTYNAVDYETNKSAVEKKNMLVKGHLDLAKDLNASHMLATIV